MAGSLLFGKKVILDFFSILTNTTISQSLVLLPMGLYIGNINTIYVVTFLYRLKKLFGRNRRENEKNLLNIGSNEGGRYFDFEKIIWNSLMF